MSRIARDTQRLGQLRDCAWLAIELVGNSVGGIHWQRVSQKMQKFRKSLSAICFFAGTFTLFGVLNADENKIAFPKGYATTYTNYLSLDRTQNPDQIIRLFANETAQAGPADDGKLPYGSQIVAEIYKAKKDDDGNVMVSSLGQRIQGDLALIAVMQREEGWGEQFPEGIRNGNWEMAAFKPDGSDAGKDLNACMACHAPYFQPARSAGNSTFRHGTQYCLRR